MFLQLKVLVLYFTGIVSSALHLLDVVFLEPFLVQLLFYTSVQALVVVRQYLFSYSMMTV